MFDKYVRRIKRSKFSTQIRIFEFFANVKIRINHLIDKNDTNTHSGRNVLRSNKI